jgi:hypothetical protein
MGRLAFDDFLARGYRLAAAPVRTDLPSAPPGQMVAAG